MPTWLAFAVTRLLEEHFGNLVDYEFTASMEEDLDRIANGDEGRVEWLKRFYFGEEATTAAGLRSLVEDLGEIDAKEISTIPIGDGIVVRVGRYGPTSRSSCLRGSTSRRARSPRAPRCRPPRAARRSPTTSRPTSSRPRWRVSCSRSQADDGKVLGKDPETGREIVARAGRYGPYVTEVIEDDEAVDKPKGKKAAKAKPRTASLFKDMELST